MREVVFLITGEPQNGKSTIRNAITAITTLQGASCSDVIYEILAKETGVPLATLKEQPKEKIRPQLIKIGDWLCGIGELRDAAEIQEPDKYYRGPSALVRALFFSDCRVIDGIRRRLELQDTLKHLEWIGAHVFVIHVVRPGFPKIQDNTEDLSEFADVVLTNDGTTADLCKKVEAQLHVWFPQQPAEPAAPPPAAPPPAAEPEVTNPAPAAAQ